MWVRIGQGPQGVCLRFPLLRGRIPSCVRLRPNKKAGSPKGHSPKTGAKLRRLEDRGKTIKEQVSRAGELSHRGRKVVKGEKFLMGSAAVISAKV